MSERFSKKLEAAQKMCQWLIDNSKKLEKLSDEPKEEEKEPKKRVREEEEEEKQDEEKPKKPKKPAAKKERKEDTDFVCPGQVWTDPKGPCVDKKNKFIPVGIKCGDDQKWTVCSDCRNAKTRYMKKQAKSDN